MIPAVIVFRHALPLTATGKVDRQLLAAEDIAQAAAIDPADAPKDAVEQQLASIFARVLNRTEIHRAKTFFDLGGDSLGLAEIIVLAEREFGVAIPPERFLQDSSIMALAPYIREHQTVGASSPHGNGDSALFVPLKVRPKARNVFVVPSRLGQAFVGPRFIELFGDSLSVYSLRARGLRAGEQPRLTIKDMAADFVQSIRKVQPHGPYFLAGICAGGIVAVVMADQLRQAGEEVSPIIAFEPPLRPRGHNSDIPREQKLKLMRQAYVLPDSRQRMDLLNRLQRREREGKIRFDAGDGEYLDRAVRVRLAFEIAMLTFEPFSHDHEILILASRRRIRRNGGTADALIGGRQHYLIVSRKHAGVLDFDNPHLKLAVRLGVDYSLNGGDDRKEKFLAAVASDAIKSGGTVAKVVRYCRKLFGGVGAQ
jgi:thioesterase domain-containing protein/acyl carrier protein